MSFPFYGKMWIATKQDLRDVVLCEKVLENLESTMNRNYVHRLIGKLYAKYLILCNNLSELYDQTLQSQKRPLVEKLMLATNERWFEILEEIQQIEMSQFVYVDNSLIEMCLVPQNVQFLRPFYFPRKRDFECQQIIDAGPKFEEVIDEATLKIPLKFRKILTPEEIKEKRKRDEIIKAVNLIKIHEKAKQGRIAAFNISEFPVELKPKPHRVDAKIIYNFKYKSDQIPLFKIKRSAYKTEFYEKPVEVKAYNFYEPPEFQVNKYGQKVLIPKVPKIEIEKEKKISDDSIQLIVPKISSNFEKISAANVIQRTYRKFRLKKLINKRRQKKLELFGQYPKLVDLDAINYRKLDEENQKKRRERKEEFDKALADAIQNEKARILKFKSEIIMEDITDSIRAWFKEMYDYAGDFDRYPEEFEGGTILVVQGETMTPEEFLIDKKKTDAQRSKEKELKKKEKKDQITAEKKAKELEKKQEVERKKRELKTGPTWDFSNKKNWKAFENLETAFNEITHEWKDIDELKNWNEAPIWDWVTIDAYADVHKELRKVVDNFMRVELEILRLALARDNDVEYKRQKPKKERKKKKEKPKIDVLEGRTLEDCYEELKKINVNFN